MQQSKALQFIYTLFIGILVATFIGLGIDAFYEKPTPPEYPKELSYPQVNSDPSKPYIQSETDRQRQIEYDQKQKDYEKKFKVYNQNVSIIALVFSVIVLVVSLTLMKNLLLLSDGLLLGGVLTLLYSVIRGFMSDSSKFRFAVVTVSLVAALIVGYIKFVKSNISQK